MTNYNNKHESKTPWLNTTDGFHKTFYPPSWNKKNSYAIFSPGIDRFLIVDNYDLWILYEAGKVLSSKVSTMVYILDKITPDDMNNETCINFTTKHKKSEKGYGGPMIMSHRQSASLSKIPKDMIIDAGWPEDFADGARKEILIKLQEYALFSLRTIYAITLSVNFRNFFPEKEYLDVFFHNQYPQDLKIYYDNSSADCGIINLIKTILYESDSTEAALESIHNAWLTYSNNDPSDTRQLFYQILGIVQPTELENLGPPGFIKDRNNQTTWVV
jgi:hypothetical protein